ncbi:MAG: cadherin-like beta sandwich domain-containing protein [Roseburia sp.]
MKKSLGMFAVAICINICCICFLMLYPKSIVFAATGKTSLAVSSGNVNIGDTVTVTIKTMGAGGEKAYADMTLSYDASILQFVDCSVVYGGGGNSVRVTGVDSATITLKAVGAGTSTLSLSASDGTLFDTAEELESVAGSSASVTVNNAAGSGGATGGGSGDAAGGTVNAGGNENGGNAGGTVAGATASADNSLKALVISPGTLSPAFSYSTTRYSATVANDVTSVAVTATPSNGKAIVESVAGNNNLAVGENTIKIVVKAENGVTATYTINVVRQAAAQPASEAKPETQVAETPQEKAIFLDGKSYEISENFKSDVIPVDFAESMVNYRGTEYKGVRFEKGALSMLYLTEQEGEDARSSFFVYDDERDMLYPFVRLTHGENYVIALSVPIDVMVPEAFSMAQLPIGESSVTVYPELTEDAMISDFSYFYGVNQMGEKGWYRYDALEGTYQRSTIEAPKQEVEAAADSVAGEELKNLQKEHDELMAQYKRIILVLICVVAVTIVINIFLLVRKRGKEEEYFADELLKEEPFEQEEWLEGEPSERAQYAESWTTEAERLPEEESMPEQESVPEQEAMPEEESLLQEEWLPEEESSPKEKPLSKKGWTKRQTEKSAVQEDDLEILDLNDL